MLVTVSGLPGAGTSTVARSVAERLGLERVDGGTIFRGLAAERGLTLAEFSVMAERDPAIDIELDRRLAARARARGVVLESRLAGWIATNEALAATRVWIDCGEDERAARVAERDRLALASARAANRRREASERARYRSYYGIDLDDLSPYDLVLDSTRTPAEALTERILAAVDTFPQTLED